MQSNTSGLVGIIADDLTSATDGAAPFLSRGYTPLIARDPDFKGCDAILAIDTDSRAASPSDAIRATRRAIAGLADRAILFKTMDSTLRGHVEAEIAAAFRASRRNRLVVAPAFPDAGRLTIGGTQWVNGVPVSESDYGRDPVHPAYTSCIADLIDPSLGQPVIVAQGRPQEAANQIAEAAILILDADSQAALNAQVSLIPDPETVLWVGSPGLAIALASIVNMAPTDRPAAPGGEGDVLIVIGSANPISHAQGQALAGEGVPIVTDVADAPSDARAICLHAPLERREDPRAVLQAVTKRAAKALSGSRFGVLIATGGETAAAVMDRIGIDRFILVDELEPGFPVGRAERGSGSPLTIAMKAGGFGSPGTLVRAVDALGHGSQPRRRLTNDGR